MPQPIPHALSYAVPRIAIIGTQLLLFPLLRLLSLIVTRGRLVHPKFSLSAAHRVVIAANHQSMLDPLIICGAMPWRVYRRLSPLYFMTANDYLQSEWTRPFLLLCGCFPAKPYRHYGSGLEQAIFLLSQDANIWIFPEGQRSLVGMTPPKQGISVIANLPRIRVLPIRIQWTLNSPRRRSAQIQIGRQFDASGQSPQKIMDHIYSLAFKDKSPPVRL